MRFVDRLFFSLLLSPQIADTEVQENEVRQSGLDWVIVQPVHLTDSNVDDRPFVSLDNETASMSVSRNSVGRFLAEAVESAEYIQTSVALSGTSIAA